MTQQYQHPHARAGLGFGTGGALAPSMIAEALGFDGAVFLLDCFTGWNTHNLSSALSFVNERNPVKGPFTEDQISHFFNSLTGIDVGDRRAVCSALKYEVSSQICQRANLTVMNYGYEEAVPSRIELLPHEEPLRYGLQLYDVLARGADIRGRSVLEVGCGHGGGAQYLSRAYVPHVYVGVDQCSEHISFCASQNQRREVSFLESNAQALPFDAQFDRVLGVESAHCYPRPDLFLDGVRRALNAGGTFHVVDIFDAEHLIVFKRLASLKGLTLFEERDVTAEVERAHALHHERVLKHADNISDALKREMYLNLVRTRTFRKQGSNWDSPELSCHILRFRAS